MATGATGFGARDASGDGKSFTKKWSMTLILSLKTPSECGRKYMTMMANWSRFTISSPPIPAIKNYDNENRMRPKNRGFSGQ